jgi:hypothetical protein
MLLLLLLLLFYQDVIITIIVIIIHVAVTRKDAVKFTRCSTETKTALKSFSDATHTRPFRNGGV